MMAKGGRFTHCGRTRRHKLALYCVLMTVFFAGCSRHAYEEREVDFEKRVVSANTGKGSHLNFALAAMISPKETDRHYVRMVRQLAKAIGQPIKLIHGRSYAHVNTQLLAGKMDMALICTGGYAELMKGKEEIPILAVPRVKGKTTYQSYVIVKADSDARSFADLVGKRFAFTDPLSNTGYLYPLSLLRAQGSTKDKFFASYTFVGSHDRAIRAVSLGAQDAAAVDHLIFEYFKKRKPETVKGLRILGRSPEYGIPPLVASPRTTRAQQRKWRQALLALHKQPQTQKTLKQLEIERFVVPEKNLYDSARRLWKETTQTNP